MNRLRLPHGRYVIPVLNLAAFYKDCGELISRDRLQCILGSHTAAYVQTPFFFFFLTTFDIVRGQRFLMKGLQRVKKEEKLMQIVDFLFLMAQCSVQALFFQSTLCMPFHRGAPRSQAGAPLTPPPPPSSVSVNAP